MPRVFISYRRADTALLADLLAERLGERFQVFVDVEAIDLGDSFMARIQRAISSADVVLVLVGANWDPSGSGARTTSSRTSSA